MLHVQAQSLTFNMKPKLSAVLTEILSSVLSIAALNCPIFAWRVKTYKNFNRAMQNGNISKSFLNNLLVDK